MWSPGRRAGYTARLVPRPALAAVLVVTLATAGCATILDPALPASPPRSAIAVDPLETADCLRITAGRRGFADAEFVLPVLDPELAAQLEAVPPDVRRVARAAGLEAVLAALLRAELTAPDDPSLSRVAMRLQVVMRISSHEIALASLLFEADCTGDQMEAVLLELDRRAGKQELALTVASIAVGALAGLGAGLWDLQGTDSKGPAVLGVAGGVATAGLGLAAFVPRRGRVVFPHDRNLFVPILAGQDPEHLYPPFVFNLLMTSHAPGEPTPRDELLAEWDAILADSIKPAERPLARTLLFGKGGMYDGNLVDVRERMYDALESQLNAFDRDLELLYRYFARLLDDPTPTTRPPP
jgi:hypothetical protein